jgi:hypothetical protein
MQHGYSTTTYYCCTEMRIPRYLVIIGLSLNRLHISFAVSRGKRRLFVGPIPFAMAKRSRSNEGPTTIPFLADRHLLVLLLTVRYLVVPASLGGQPANVPGKQTSLTLRSRHVRGLYFGIRASWALTLAPKRSALKGAPVISQEWDSE